MLFTLILLLTLFSGFFSGSEAAIFSQDSARLKRAHTNPFSPSLRNTIALWLKKPERIITGLLLGNLIVNIGITHSAETWILSLFGTFNHRHIVLPIVITLYVLAFGEVIPKVLALLFKDKWIQVLEVPLRIWFRLAQFFTAPFDRLTAAIVNPLGQERVRLTENELMEAVRIAEDHGLLTSAEMRMLSRSIAFHHNTVYAAMQARSQILLLSEDSSVQKVRKAFSASGQNFAAIYRKNSTEVVGVMYLRGIVQLQLSRQKNLSSKIHSIDFLPASLSLSNALASLMRERRDIAAVIDEAGAFLGLVTLRGIINHVLGASFSSVRTDADLEKLDNRRYRIGGKMPLDRFNEIFRTDFDAELSETIGGFLLEKLDGFPREDAEIRIGSLIFRNMEIEDHRLLRFVLVVKRGA